MALAAGALIEIEVERAVAGGRMLARHDGAVVLVSGAIPGERIHARVTRVTRHVAFADTVEVRGPSPDRRVPRCPLACGGLAYAHIRYDRQRQLKADVVVDAFRRLGHLDLAEPPPVLASPEDGYRLRARLHVRGQRAGFFEEGTHTLCDPVATGQLLPAACQSVQALVDTLGPRASQLDSVIVAENVAATDRVLHLEPRPGERLDRLAIDDRVRAAATGVSAAVGGRTIRLAGDPVVRESSSDLPIAGLPEGCVARWSRHASSFFQGNRYLTGPLLAHVLECAAGDRIVDLYAGVGLYAVALAARGADVTAIEGDRASSADLRANAEPWEPRLQVIRARVEDVVRHAPDPLPDAAIVNPPRSGISAAAVTHLAGWRVPRIVYVSCDPPTLARDAARFAAAGYGLRSLRAFDLFPNTPHVETVVEFGRETGPGT